MQYFIFLDGFVLNKCITIQKAHNLIKEYSITHGAICEYTGNYIYKITIAGISPKMIIMVS